jgi:hypothetical protein
MKGRALTVCGKTRVSEEEQHQTGEEGSRGSTTIAQHGEVEILRGCPRQPGAGKGTSAGDTVSWSL